VKEETPITEYLREGQRAAVYGRDLERINAAADRLNREALDALEYQATEENSDRG
jgi:hypothetical protein